MTNPMINPQPNYSGVTIQISNPAVNVGHEPNCNGQFIRNKGGDYCTNPLYCQNGLNISKPQNAEQFVGAQPAYMTAYPPQYYLNNYNYQNNGDKENVEKLLAEIKKSNAENYAQFPANNSLELPNEPNQANADKINLPAKVYEPKEEVQDFSKSDTVINDLNARAEALEKEKKNTKQKRVITLTDEYIKSLENYLDNPDSEIRLMASKEILVRLDEDKDRFNDAALNALLNKMLQDPSKLIRVAALSAFASRLASGNDYTVKLLQNIQTNPNADKEDVLQAADILLKMTSSTEIKNIPIETKQTKNNIEPEQEKKPNIEPIQRDI